MDLTNLILGTVIISDRCTLEITPFCWRLTPKKTKIDRGDYDNHKIAFLCFVFWLLLLNKKGREGKAYRASLKKK